MNLEDLISRNYELTGVGNWLHGVDHDSLVIDVKKQIFYWNSRGVSGDKYTWLTKVLGKSHEEAKEFLRLNDKENSYNFIHTIRDEKEVVVYPKLVDFFYEEGINNRGYWYKRGINDTTIHRFKLGFHDDWFMIPIYQDGLFRNFQMRRDDPKMIKSYYKSQGRLLFNSDMLRISDTVYICEGPTDCLRLIQEGWPAISHNAGSEGWDANWNKYFVSQKNIIILYDNDNAGIEGAKKVAENLGLYRCKLYNFDGLDEKYDIVDWFNEGHSSQELKYKIETEGKYAFEYPNKQGAIKKWKSRF